METTRQKAKRLLAILEEKVSNNKEKRSFYQSKGINTRHLITLVSSEIESETEEEVFIRVARNGKWSDLISIKKNEIKRGYPPGKIEVPDWVFKKLVFFERKTCIK